jgi:hypothetical protein
MAMRSPRISMSRYAPILVAAALAAAAAQPAAAAQYNFMVDVPTVLGGVDYTPGQIVRATGSGYVLEIDSDLPDGVDLSTLLRTPEGFWLVTPSVPVPDNEPSIEPRDVILFDPVTETVALVLDGSDAGIPEYAAIDALIYNRATDQIAMSFDVPVRINGVEYGHSDLVVYGAGGFSMLWSAVAAGVPPSANVVGADEDAAGRLVLSFDVPVTLGGAIYRPGQLVQWTSGGGFSLYASDPAWPASSVLVDFGFVPASGEVPDGSAGSVPLTVAPAAGGQITLSWGGSCAGTDSDYEVYEGTIGTPFSSHVPVTCSTGGATSWTFTPGAGDRYYYVVPRNAVTEGSYGERSGGLQRPPSGAACLPQEVGPTCG